MPLLPPSRRRGSTSLTGTAALAAAAGLAFTSCSTAAPGPSPAVTVTVTATPSPSASPTASGWNLEEPSNSSGTAPDFPTRVNGWKFDFSWTTVTRAFDDTWSTSYGENEPWPISQDSCAGRFLVRWRSAERGTPMRSRYGMPSFSTSDDAEKPTIVAPSKAVTGGAGWMVLNGCQAPQFRLTKGLGFNLSDVTAEVQHWQEAP